MKKLTLLLMLIGFSMSAQEFKIGAGIAYYNDTPEPQSKITPKLSFEYKNVYLGISSNLANLDIEYTDYYFNEIKDVLKARYYNINVGYSFGNKLTLTPLAGIGVSNEVTLFNNSETSTDYSIGLMAGYSFDRASISISYGNFETASLTVMLDL